MGICALTEGVRVEVTAEKDGISRSDALRRAIVYFGQKIFSHFDSSADTPTWLSEIPDNSLYTLSVTWGTGKV